MIPPTQGRNWLERLLIHYRYKQIHFSLSNHLEIIGLTVCWFVFKLPCLILMWIYYFLVINLKIEIRLFKTKLFVFIFILRGFQSYIMDRIDEPLLFDSGYVFLLLWCLNFFLVLVISKMIHNLKYAGISCGHAVYILQTDCKY